MYPEHPGPQHGHRWESARCPADVPAPSLLPAMSCDDLRPLCKSVIRGADGDKGGFCSGSLLLPDKHTRTWRLKTTNILSARDSNWSPACSCCDRTQWEACWERGSAGGWYGISAPVVSEPLPFHVNPPLSLSCALDGMWLGFSRRPSGSQEHIRSSFQQV